MKGPLSEAWGQFLSQFSWDWFVTLTFRDPVKSFRAHNLLKRYLRDLDRAAGIPIFWFCTEEIGPRGGLLAPRLLRGAIKPSAGQGS